MNKQVVKSQRRRGSGVASAAGALLATPVALSAGWIAYSALAVEHALPISKAIDAEWSTFLGERSGLLTYYLDRHSSGRPLVLLHSINAAGSSYEMRPLFEYYRHTRPVFALDLPGFGFSERTDRVYSPQLYQDAILDFLESEVGEPADVIALSLGCEFAARAAVVAPERFHSLTMISPTGFTSGRQSRGSQQASANRTSGTFYRLFAFPLWAQAFYDLVATRSSIEFFLKQSFAGPVDTALMDYAYLTAHQPGARYAPLYFVSGRLFTRQVCQRIYEQLTRPVLVIYDRDAFVRFDMLPEFVGQHSNWRTERIMPTRGLPQFERLPDLAAALDKFWNEW